MSITSVLLLFVLSLLTGCGDSSSSSDATPTPETDTYRSSHRADADTAIAGASSTITDALAAAPATYSFTSQFGDDSSVSHTGQTFRQVLIEDLKSYISDLTRGGSNSKADLLEVLGSYYEYTEDQTSTVEGAIKGTSSFGASAKDTNGDAATLLQTGGTYADVQSSGKQLKNKLAGIDNDLRQSSLLGFSENTAETPEALIAGWFDELAELATEGSALTVSNGDQDDQSVTAAYVTDDGRDLNQLIQKFVHGAVSFSQACGDYFSTDLGDSKGLNVDNTTAVDGKTYTNLEHHWDEGFGYFGAAHNYGSYTDQQIKDGVSIDADEDGSIDLLSERNFGLSINAAKRDLGAAEGTLDITSGAFTAMRQGRHLITAKPDGYMDILPSIAVVAITEWEKAITATVIHYINDTLDEMDKFGTADYSFTKHAKVWSEMKGFALAHQFCPKTILDDDGFAKMHTYMGDKPVLQTAEEATITDYKQALKDARSLLETAYEWTSVEVENL